MVCRWSLLVCCAAAGCFVAQDGGYAGESYMPPDQPPYNCMDGSSTGPCETTDGAASECQGSSDCPGDEICTATFDGDIGRFRCESLCVVNEDATSWCFDDAACCDSNAVCTRGLCIASDVASTSDTSGNMDSSTTSTDPSGSGGSSTSVGSTSGDAASTSTGGTG
ncbi:MAG TPA: hypothetical protein VG755_14840 [Nannocystaceae bacterium]|nr:hypothetical protein [Nannocystaceae bacterium]